MPGSREMLALTAAALYTKRVITENNRALSGVAAPVRVRARAPLGMAARGRCAMVLGPDGVRTAGDRAAAARRTASRASRPESATPPLLGGTVIDLLAREEGERAAVELACRFHPGGSRQALAGAFRGRPLVHTEGAWRAHLARLAGAQ